MRVMQRPRLLTPRPDWGLSTRQQRSLTTHASAAYTFSGRNPLALWTGRGGEMQVERRPMLPTGRDGAQRVTRHFPTWRDGCDEDMSGIRIVRSLRRIAHSLAASAVRRQPAARAVYCASGGVVACYAVIICACGCVGGCPDIHYSDTGGRSCEFARALSAAAMSAQSITAERLVCGLTLSTSACRQAQTRRGHRPALRQSEDPQPDIVYQLYSGMEAMDLAAHPRCCKRL